MCVYIYIHICIYLCSFIYLNENVEEDFRRLLLLRLRLASQLGKLLAKPTCCEILSTCLVNPKDQSTWIQNTSPDDEKPSYQSS